MKRILKLLFFSTAIVFFTLSSQAVSAQRVKRTKTDKQRKEQIDKEGENRARMEEDLSKKQQHHYDIQDKATRKRMKANQKRQQRINSGKQAPFYKRWFRKKRFK